MLLLWLLTIAAAAAAVSAVTAGASVGEQHESGLEERLFSVYVPTNHVYIGDVFLVNPKEIIRPQLTVREGIGTLLPLARPHAPSCVLVHVCAPRVLFPLHYQTRKRVVLGGSAQGSAAVVPALSVAALWLDAEIVVSGGMSMPSVLRPFDPNTLSPGLRPLL